MNYIQSLRGFALRGRSQAAAVLACAGALLAPGVAHAQSEVGFTIFEDYSVSPETAWAVWSSDPGAPISVTRMLDTDSEVWLIDLSNSGHATLGGGAFPGQPGGAFTWFEPEEPGLFNNLYFIDATHWRLESEVPFAANPANGGFGVFPNGTSIYAGSDFNSDSVFVAVTEVPAPGAMSALAVGGLTLMRRRRR